MSEYVYTYATIVAKAKAIKKNVEKEYKIGEYNSWGYYIAKAVITPNKQVKKVTVGSAPKPVGDYISKQIYKSDYLDVAKRLTNYVEKNKVLPNYVTWDGKKIRVRDYIYMLARVLVYYDSNKAYPKYANINTKCWSKPTENTDEVYNYFVKTFGKVTCIDDAMEKIAGRGYGYYYDDVYSNRQSIDRIKNRQGVNCTDATQMMKHVADATGKYKKVDCIHMKCKGGDGHVYLRITKTNGEVFYRDPAACLDNGYINSVWCSNGTVLAINPSWWTANLNR